MIKLLFVINDSNPSGKLLISELSISRSYLNAEDFNQNPKVYFWHTSNNYLSTT